MGPRSTIPFVDMVVDECALLQYGAVYDMDFPAMLIYSLPVTYPSNNDMIS